MNTPPLSGKHYQAFLTTALVDQARTPISGERIVIVLGVDETTGLPLELSIDLRKQEEGSISIYAIKEPALGEPKRALPDLIVEEVPAVNVRRISIRIRERGKPLQE